MNERFEGLVSQEQKTETFEEKFKRRETLRVADEDVEVLDISPEKKTHEDPVIYISGYGDGSPEGRKANVSTLMNEGWRTIMVKSSHGVEVAPQELEKGFPESIVRQVAAIAPVLENKQIEKISAIGESRGGAVALLAAYLYPEKFKDLVLVDPAGLVEAINAGDLTLRFILGGMAEGKIFAAKDKAGEVSALTKEQVTWGTSNFMKWILKNPITSAKEIRDIGHAEMVHLLRHIKERGVGVSIVHAVEDKVFPMADVQKSINKEVENAEEVLRAENKNDDEIAKAYKQVVDGFYSVKGGHGAINTEPERYTWLASQALTALEEKRKKYNEQNTGNN